MIVRWLRRHIGIWAGHPESSLDDVSQERGNLVRRGRLVSLRTHVPANREAFQRWYADREIAELLRHDLEPLTPAQSRGYFDTFILPSSARGTCFAIHERGTERLIGTTALTDRINSRNGGSALFRIVIGEKDAWDKGYGTEATVLLAMEAFGNIGLSEIRLEVFHHNQRAMAAYSKAGFEVSGEHVEWVPHRQTELRVVEMRLSRDVFLSRGDQDHGDTADRLESEGPRHARRILCNERGEAPATRREEAETDPVRTASGSGTSQFLLSEQRAEPD